MRARIPVSAPEARPPGGALDVRLRRIEAGPRRECCRPWGRRAASDRFNAPPTFDSARRIGGPLRHRGRLLLWTDPAGRGAGAEPTDILRAIFF
ncbi:MAG TPA: hypothetical protein PLN41_12795 [Methanothrix sp.]|nr:hypothetical protein [Methanothrix sp.]